MFPYRKVLLSLLAPLGASTIVGTGFSVWVFSESFGDEAKTPDTDIDVTVTESTNQGKIKVISQPVKVVLSESTQNITNLFDGINFYTERKIDIDGSSQNILYSSGELTFRYYNNSTFLDNDVLSQAGLKLNIGVHFDLTSLVDATTGTQYIDKYLTLADSFLANVKPPEYKYLTDKQIVAMDDELRTKEFFFVTDNLSLTNSVGFTYDKTHIKDEKQPYIEVSANLNNLFKYTSSDVKPSDKEKYQQLSSDLTGKKWNVSIVLVAYYSEITTTAETI